MYLPDIYQAAYLAQSGECRDGHALRGIMQRFLENPFVEKGERKLIEDELQQAA